MTKKWNWMAIAAALAAAPLTACDVDTHNEGELSEQREEAEEREQEAERHERIAERAENTAERTEDRLEEMSEDVERRFD